VQKHRFFETSLSSVITVLYRDFSFQMNIVKNEMEMQWLSPWYNTYMYLVPPSMFSQVLIASQSIANINLPFKIMLQCHNYFNYCILYVHEYVRHSFYFIKIISFVKLSSSCLFKCNTTKWIGTEIEKMRSYWPTRIHVVWLLYSPLAIPYYCDTHFLLEACRWPDGYVVLASARKCCDTIIPKSLPWW
jgi:hypothetical protein